MAKQANIELDGTITKVFIERNVSCGVRKWSYSNGLISLVR